MFITNLFFLCCSHDCWAERSGVLLGFADDDIGEGQMFESRAAQALG